MQLRIEQNEEDTIDMYELFSYDQIMRCWAIGHSLAQAAGAVHAINYAHDAVETVDDELKAERFQPRE